MCERLTNRALARVNALVSPYADDCRSAVDRYGSSSEAIDAYLMVPRRIIVEGDWATSLATTAAGVDGPTLTIRFRSVDGRWLIDDFDTPPSILLQP